MNFFSPRPESSTANFPPPDGYQPKRERVGLSKWVIEYLQKHAPALLSVVADDYQSQVVGQGDGDNPVLDRKKNG